MSSTLRKGLRVLEALAYGTEPKGITQIAREIDMNQSAVQRMLTTLVQAGYVEQPEGSRKYRLTFSLWEIGTRSISEIPLRRLVHPILRLGAQMTGLTCFFALSAPPFVIYLDKVEGVNGRPHSAEPGRKIPMTKTAAGRAIYPFLPAKARGALTRDATDWSGYVRYRAEDPDEIDRITQEVRARRYSTSISGLRKGVNSVAAPVWSHRPTPFGSIVLTADEKHLKSADFAAYGARVFELSEEATLALGGTAQRNFAELSPA